MFHPLDERDYEQIAALLQGSFIADELRPYDQQRALLHESRYHIYVEQDEMEGEIAAFIAIWNFERFFFVDYLAVHPDFRGHGLGSHLLSEIRKLSSLPVCLEIETPVDDVTHRRQHFYEQNGFLLCPLSYEQPPVARGNAPVALSLMSSEPITDETFFAHVCHEIYEYAYKRFL